MEGKCQAHRHMLNNAQLANIGEGHGRHHRVVTVRNTGAAKTRVNALEGHITNSRKLLRARVANGRSGVC
jgi:hypothetical protein